MAAARAVFAASARRDRGGQWVAVAQEEALPAPVVPVRAAVVRAASGSWATLVAGQVAAVGTAMQVAGTTAATERVAAEQAAARGVEAERRGAEGEVRAVQAVAAGRAGRAVAASVMAAQT